MKATSVASGLWILLLFVTCLQAQAQRVFIDENINYWYNITNDVHIRHHLITENDTSFIFLDILFNNGRMYDEFDYTLELHKSYHTGEILKTEAINLKDRIIAIKSGEVFTRISVPLAEKADLAVFKINDKNAHSHYAYDIPLIKDYNYPADGLIFYEKNGNTPHLTPFINKGEEFMIKSISTYDAPIFVYYYSHVFEAAVPPMVIDHKPSGKAFRIDSVFSVSLNDTLRFSSEGLYFFQKDSSGVNGIGIRVQDEYFPLVKTFHEVLKPLIYISKKSETDAIRTAPDPKVAFEKYWLSLVNIPNQASKTIKKFYERVEGANFLFTSYKEGWKTDMGMIYIVYGPPNEVYKSEEIIDWVYNRDMAMPTVRFSFYKVKNVFTDQHYTLQRKKQYDKNWFKSVELWRTGRR